MTAIEAIIRRERAVLVVALVLVPLICWAWIVPMARDMYGPMTGPSSWMMTPAWDFRYTTLIAAMWIVMMIGMMLPSAAPTLLIYAAVVRRYEGPRAAMRVYSMAAGYVLVWVIFSVGATLLQRELSARVLSPMMKVVSPWAAAALLLVAAGYQMTPLKSSCLDSCRSPVDFIVSHMRQGVTGAFHLGIDHGVICVGCCWALMLLLFAGGVMNLWTIASLTVFVVFEKLAPFGGRTRVVSAAGLVALAVWILAV
ncbi:MAG TPA: DUF2182 domain-containing protein [Vicinamibacterales bacterium]|nr:DUF2182 domain-containing protein [Vicinamibacterales bacterium]